MIIVVELVSNPGAQSGQMNLTIISETQTQGLWTSQHMESVTITRFVPYKPDVSVIINILYYRVSQKDRYDYFTIQGV